MLGAIARGLARLAIRNLTLEDAQTRHARRPPLPEQFDFEEMRRDHEAGRISRECRNWLEMMIVTEPGTPVYTAMLSGLEDARRPEFEAFRRFVVEIWTPEEAEHGECALRLAKAIGFDFDPAMVRDEADWARGYFEACPPCHRVLGTAAYTVIQEELTYLSHRAYAECSGSPELTRMGHAIAAEERYHACFYASRLRDALEVAALDGMTEEEASGVVAEVVARFQMPTNFHSRAFRQHVNQEMRDQAKAHFLAHKATIKRQLGPLFMAAGGLPLVRAVVRAKSPIGRYADEDAEAYARSSPAGE